MMNLDPKTIYLKDYRSPSYLIDSIELDVEIFDDFTMVNSKLSVMRNKDSQQDHFEELTLQGENMELLEVSLNGRVLSDDNYSLTPKTLTIKNIHHNEFIVQVKNKIYPHQNRALEGFYKSGEQLCTQCEPEGFRRITYFLDRPDVMSVYKVKMTADAQKYPYLLSNGNKVNSKKLSSGRHFVEWHDPHRKPSYLFAMVAGDFDLVRDQYKTLSGKVVDLEIYVDKGQSSKTNHAMQSLKDSMKWDEEKFGLEYDLDIYMIVAVDSFNMGAMENKGLNIFNSSYVLADEKTATDQDFQNIQSVIGHEYFHNWTGNRVTCRDWFQLTLKEGLTVFRDQEFSADMLSEAVKRIEDVKNLKEFQFPEDQGPLSHPIRPDHYIEINNFYTRTVYEKGAEIIRMIQTLIGRENFRKGMDEYFKLYDGKAVTTENFIHAMEIASKKDLTPFKNWYDQAGTPLLKINFTADKDQPGRYHLEVSQMIQNANPSSSNMTTQNQSHLLMPFKVGFIDEKKGLLAEKTFEIKKEKESFDVSLEGIDQKNHIVLSLNRSFSAPVLVDFDYTFDDLLTLIQFDNDPYARFEAMQLSYQKLIKDIFYQQQKNPHESYKIPDAFKKAFESVLRDETIDLSFKSLLLELPTENSLFQQTEVVDFDLIQSSRKEILTQLGESFFPWFLETHESLKQVKKDHQVFELTPKAFGERSLRNQCLAYIVAIESKESFSILEDHFKNAINMTEELFALQQFIKAGVDFEHFSIWEFYHKWKNESLVMQKWIGSLASYSPKSESLKRILTLEKDPCFQKQVPNFLRALYLQFAKNNLVSFHQSSGEGYQFIADKIIEIDSFNPQVASRLASSFSMMSRLDKGRQVLMRNEVHRILNSHPSQDTFELVSKFIDD